MGFSVMEKSRNDGRNAVEKARDTRIKNAGKSTRFSATNQPEKRGHRAKKMKNVIKEIPPDAQEAIATTMFRAIACRNTKEAIATINETELKGGDYGLIYEEVIKAIKKEGLHAIILVLEWIYGKNINNRITGEIKTDTKLNYRPYEGLTIEEIRRVLNEKD